MMQLKELGPGVSKGGTNPSSFGHLLGPSAQWGARKLNLRPGQSQSGEDPQRASSSICPFHRWETEVQRKEAIWPRSRRERSAAEPKAPVGVPPGRLDTRPMTPDLAEASPER